MTTTVAERGCAAVVQVSAGDECAVVPVDRCGLWVGAVLCGGRSARMGRDKALLELGGRSLLERALETLEALCGHVILAVGPEPRYGEFGRPCVLDRGTGLGPLAGLEAALAAAEERGAAALCVLGCDMPRVRAEHFGQLLTAFEEGDADLVLAQGPRGLEPLLGIYGLSVLGPVRAALDRGARSLRSFHREVGLQLVEFTDAEALLNLNSPEELARARMQERER